MSNYRFVNTVTRLWRDTFDRSIRDRIGIPLVPSLATIDANYLLMS